jgi:L-methionine (R)-S-oxide reductase
MAKAVQTRLSREQAKGLLTKIDSTLASPMAPSGLHAVVKLLNGGVPTYSWVGVYRLRSSELHLEAWSGPAPSQHQTVPLGRGICGFVAMAGRAEIVSDVSKDPRYLQCFLSTKSEIVVPILNSGKVVGEIDIDSDQLDSFSSVDREFLEAVGRKVAERWL